MNFAKKATEYAAALEGDLNHPPVNYLENRGLTRANWLPFRIGYASWCECISLPHHDAGGNIVGVRLRYFGTDTSQKRYGAHKESAMGLFGLLQLMGRPSLIITEGELNAISVAAVRGKLAYDVLSIGSETSVPEGLAELAGKYRKVLLMVDEERCAKRLIDRLKHPRLTHGLSPPIEGEKYDANAFLMKGAGDDLRDCLCMGLHALSESPFPLLPVTSEHLLRCRTNVEAAEALLAFRIPGMISEQLALRKLIGKGSLDQVGQQAFLLPLILAALLYELPEARGEARDRICSNLRISPDLLQLPAPLRAD